MRGHILTLFMFLFTMESQAHPLKMAYTSITYNSQKKVLEITHRLFQDDFEKILAGIYKYDKDIYLNQKTQKAHSALYTFFEKNFSITINNEKIKSSYINIEQKNQMGIVISFESDIVYIENLKSIKIYNSLMMEGFKEQVNMLRLNIPETMLRTLKFQFQTREHTISI